MEATPEGFESWLTDHLNQLQLDGDVYSGYIHGTLLTTDDDFAVEDVEKYVLDVVSGFIVSALDSLTQQLCLLYFDRKKNALQRRSRRCVSQCARR